MSDTMSTQSTPANLLDGTRRQTVSGSPSVPPLQLFAWSVQRELWDNRSLYLAPAIVAVLALLGFFLGPFGVENMTSFSSPNVGHDHATADVPFFLATGVIMATSVLVSVFYAADAMYAERRDRSILFWKSLPVSDLIAVLAKASIPLLVVPLIAFGTIVVTHLVMALASSVVLMRAGLPVAPLWTGLALPRTWAELLGHLLAAAALWYAPFYGWLLLISALVPRAPLLWAFLPPLAVSILEVIEFHTSYIGSALKERLAHGSLTFVKVGDSNRFIAPQTFAEGLRTPELWGGLLVAAAFLAGAVQLRRYRSTL